MQTLKLTSKRQATLPARLCEEMAVVPGDELLLERTEIDGKPAWFLMSRKSLDKSWLCSLKKYGKGKSHDMGDIRSSIGKRGKS